MPERPLSVAYIGLGSNLGDRLRHLHAAVTTLPTRGVIVLRVSAVYTSQYVGLLPDSQPEYLNCAAEVQTTLSPHALLSCLKALEQAAGRLNEGDGGPRPLDLDVLLYGDSTLQDERLTVPHPRMWDRAFVLLPLLELAPDLRTPSGVPIGERAQELLRMGQRARRIMTWRDVETYCSMNSTGPH